MNIKYNQQEIKKAYYNNVELKSIVYNGKEIFFDPSYSFKHDKSKINQTELTFESEAGEAKVNLYTGRMRYEYLDMQMGEGSFKLGISHIYNSKWVEEDYPDSVYGIGFKLNIIQYCYPYHYNDIESQQGFKEGDYVYIDNLGYKHRFIYYKENKQEKYYYDESGTHLRLIIKEDKSSQIKDPSGNIIEFDQDGKVVAYVSAFNENIKKIIEYENKNISRVYDSRKPYRFFQFTYDDQGKLNFIECIEKEIVKKTIQYHYKQHHLVKISEHVGRKSKDQVSFYYEDNRLISAINETNKNGFLANYQSLFPNSYQVNCIQIGCAILNNDFVSMPSENIKKYTRISYQKLETEIINEKNLRFVYQFNDKGFTSAIFEKVKENEYKTLTKNNGWALSNSKNGTTIINHQQSNLITNGQFEISPSCINNFLKIFEPYSNGLKSKYLYCQNFILSFYVKLKQRTFKDIKANLQVKTSYEYPFEFATILDKSAYNVWQHVTIPMDFQMRESILIDSKEVESFFNIHNYNQNLSSLRETENMTLIFEGLSHDAEMEISNIQIEIGSQTQTIIDHVNFNYADKIKYFKDSFNWCEEKISSEMYFSESDIWLTYKNRYLQKGSNNRNRFDMVCCNGTKVISVQDIYFKRKMDKDYHYFNIDKNGAPNYFIQAISRLDKAKYLKSETRMQFFETHYKQQVAVNYIKHYRDVLLETNPSINEMEMYYNQLIKRKKDAHNIITENRYDDYGNLEVTKTYFDEKEEVFLQQYEYDTNLPSSREIPIQTTQNGVTTNQEYSSPFFNLKNSTLLGNNPTFYKQVTNYDAFKEKILQVQAVDDIAIHAQNDLIYNQQGYLKELKDSFGYHYCFEYDLFGNPLSYKEIDAQNNEIELYKKQYIYNDPNANYQSIVKETYPNNDTQNQRTIIHDSYGRLKSIQNNDEKIEYEYQKINESASLAQVEKMVDPYDGQSYTFQYNSDNQITGYQTTGSLSLNNKHVSLRQIDTNTTNYILHDGVQETTRTSQIISEDSIEKNPIFLNPYIHQSKDYDDEESNKQFHFHYSYDSLARLIKKESNYQDGEMLKNIHTTIYSYVKGKPDQIKTYNYHLLESRYSASSSSIRKTYDLNFNFEYTYNDCGNLISILEKQSGIQTQIEQNTQMEQPFNLFQNEYMTTYQYDSLNRLKQETNTILNLNRTYHYKDGKLLSTTNQGLTEKTYYYNQRNLISSVVSNFYTQNFTYDNFGNVRLIQTITSNEQIETSLSWERGNLLSQYGNTKYFYNHQGNRFKKETSNLIKDYYLDGSKILGEDWSDGTKIRYYYDIHGLVGMKYNDTYYRYALDIQGNVKKIFKKNKLLTEYHYDSQGNCKIINYDPSKDAYVTTNGTQHIGYINPFRYKSYYYDTESNLYYMEGRYYHPFYGFCLNADNPDRLLYNAFILNGLNRQVVTIDNLIFKKYNMSCVYSSRKYYPDSSYYSGEGMSWFEVNFEKILTGVFIAVFVLSLILYAIPQTNCIGKLMLKDGFKNGLRGMVINGMIGGFIASIQGNNFFKGVQEGMIQGFMTGFIFGALSGFFKGIGSNCFKAGTLILTSEGHKKIEDIQVGDKVWAYDEKSQSKRLKKVVQVFQNKTKKWLHIHINEEEIICTPEHPFYVINPKEVPTLQFEGREANKYEGEWVASKDLKEGMQVLLANGKYATIEVVETEELDTFETTYNFEVEDVHTYFVSSCNVLVHNYCGPVRDPNEKNLYRGGNNMTIKENEIKIVDGMVQPKRGISVNANPDLVKKFGPPHQIGKLPKELKTILTKGTHYEIIPAYEMTLEEYQALLNLIPLEPI